MENFEVLQGISSFCKVLVKKTTVEKPECTGKSQTGSSEKEFLERSHLVRYFGGSFASDADVQLEHEEPLIDVFEEDDHVRILVQCRCQEQQVTFHPSKDGLVVCREECFKEKDGAEICRDVCRKVSLRTDRLQLENMLFLVAKCNNNNTLEAMIPKIKQ